MLLSDWIDRVEKRVKIASYHGCAGLDFCLEQMCSSYREGVISYIRTTPRFHKVIVWMEEEEGRTIGRNFNDWWVGDWISFKWNRGEDDEEYECDCSDCEESDDEE